MTRKDYILLAAALLAAKPRDLLTNDAARNAWYACVTEIASTLQRDNTRFNAARFFDACKVPS